ncbi:MAG: methylmalonyl Co-A mutase-associated GTPase MeaB, partial [Verrucomicrobiota bacterium]
GGIRGGDATILARAITLVESNAPRHLQQAQELLAELMPDTGGSVRVGITGVPGAGKSTFIEALGTWLCDQGRKVAVLAVDPSSSVTRGSILGDKTRMEQLARHPNAFIRPSPSAGTLGGVTRKSRETILLCEAFGFDTILVETVGVGQSETTVRSMVDFFLLVLIAGAGDELQGIKKGVIELADMILVNKADGANVQPARMARAEYGRVLSFLQPATPGWKTIAQTCSAREGTDIDKAWRRVEEFVERTKASGFFDQRRASQRIDWMRSMIEDSLRAAFFGDPQAKAALAEIEPGVASGNTPATAAVQELMDAFWQRKRENSHG